MDKAQEENNDGPTKPESDQYLWLAAAFVGGFLIIMIVLIIGIILWRYVKKQNTSIDQNWAGPSPLADGNIQEEGNCMNSIFGISRSHSNISTCPIINNEHQTVKEVHGIGVGIQHGNSGEEEANEKKLTHSTMNEPTVLPAPTKHANPASGDQMSTQVTENGLKDKTFPPPPLDFPQEFPMPPEPEAMHDLQNNHMQTFPEINSYQRDENSTQEPLSLQIRDTDAYVATNLEDQLLPPPPPDF